MNTRGGNGRFGSRRGRYNRRAKFVCQRSGMVYPISQAVVEPGTGLIVHWSESDGMYNRVNHPQNFSKKIGPDNMINPYQVQTSDGYQPLEGEVLSLESGYQILLEEGGILVQE